MTVEESIREENLSDFYKLFRYGDVVYIAHRRANSHGRFE
jgi:collagenase-like PrtC family protease